jgi:hypothetical protein
MIVVVSSSGDGDPEVSLEEPDECTRFHLEGRGVTVAEIAEALAADGAGRVDGDVAFIELAAVRRLAAGRVEEDWDNRFEAMCGYARSKGWIDEGARIQAHIELS